MKLITPLEFRIQQKGEQYGDDELIRDAREVYSMKQDLERLHRSNVRLGVAFLVSFALLGAIAILRMWRLIEWL